MNSYLLTLVIKDSLKEEERKKLLASITEKFAKMEKEDLWGVKNLSYPIEHQERAYFAHFEFQADPKTVPPLEKQVRLNEDIIRHLLIRK